MKKTLMIICSLIIAFLTSCAENTSENKSKKKTVNELVKYSYSFDELKDSPINDYTNKISKELRVFARTKIDGEFGARGRFEDDEKVVIFIAQTINSNRDKKFYALIYNKKIKIKI
ncbi:hypothetical protein BST92_14260 [Nonlabens arenilitoris]|uniref:Lipoprotein n=1 Tax=Nonlabens arenilitoris TaxID=1217969 RepID=A0A2S7UDK0_9FLAO|nr:hypothetical protein [Nonlabens arenilitoris]PQJ33015.1 hypothetical protein BST92_14260 [Nonlabens arenilitoris]